MADSDNKPDLEGPSFSCGLAFVKEEGVFDRALRRFVGRRAAEFTFTEAGFGFGEFVIVQDETGIYLNSERMSLDRVKKYLCALVDEAILDSDKSPDNHLAYNKAMGVIACGCCGYERTEE